MIDVPKFLKIEIWWQICILSIGAFFQEIKISVQMAIFRTHLLLESTIIYRINYIRFVLPRILVWLPMTMIISYRSKIKSPKSSNNDSYYLMNTTVCLDIEVSIVSQGARSWKQICLMVIPKPGQSITLYAIHETPKPLW